METWSRDFRQRTLQVLAALGLVLALALMGAVLMSSAASGDSKSDGDTLTAQSSDASSVASEGKQADLDGSSSNNPSALGIMLGVLVIGTGVTVLALGARRPERHQHEPDLVPLD